MVFLKGLPVVIAKISNNRLVPGNFERRETLAKASGWNCAPVAAQARARRQEVSLPEENEIRITLPAHTKDEKENDSRSSQHDMT